MRKIWTVQFAAIVAVAFAIWQFSFLSPRAQEYQGEAIRTGVFYLVEGASYKTPTLSGITNSKGEFHYRPGEVVTFSIDDLVLGSAPGAKRLTTAHLVLGVSGDIKKLKYRRATNMARFVQSLDEDGNVENGITITARTRDLVSQYNNGKINFDKSETDFAQEPSVVELFAKLHKTVRTGPQARNYVRWTLLGIQVATDVKIPTRDGSYVLADIFRPIDEGKYPPIVQLASYGKVYLVRGCDCNQTDVLFHEAELDKYFEGNPENRNSEVMETTDMWYWVPKGYVAIRIDGPGVCNSPGVLAPYSVKETETYYDAIEWAAKQPWSNGKVGTFGSSYFGINQVNVAGLQPPHLAAMIDGAGDSDRYNQVVYAGGILNAQARQGWWDEVKKNRCLNQKTVEDTIGQTKTEYWLAHPFNEAPWYGTYDVKPPLEIDGSMDKVNVPFISFSPMTHPGAEHVRGGIELYMSAATKPENKQLRVITGDFNAGYLYDPLNQPYFLAFFEHWLKGVPNDVMNDPHVKMQVRTGGGGWYWQDANEYPPANTEYKKIYLDASPSGWAGDGKRTDFMKLSLTASSAQASKSYSADVHFDAKTCGAPGVSFTSEPLAADTVLAGFVELHLWISSTSSDADIFASVRVMDKNNEEIPYALSGRGFYPVGKGWQRVSHRVLDKNKSTIFRPWPSNTKADYAPLKSPDEVVPVNVEIEPTTALIKKGDRIRLDIQPVDGCDWGSPHYWDASYHQGASNTVYTGGDHTSYLQLPVIPSPK